jgi:hypothetical protein
MKNVLKLLAQAKLELAKELPEITDAGSSRGAIKYAIKSISALIELLSYYA